MDAPTQAPTSWLDTGQLQHALTDPNNAVIILCIAVGYLIKVIPIIPDKWAKAAVLLTGVIAGVTSLQPEQPAGLPAHTIGTFYVGLSHGIIYAALSMMIYDLALSKIEAFIRSKFSFGTDPNPPAK